jgi:hypothetical protein
MEAIQDKNKEAFEYLTGISKKLWTRAFAPYPKWGHDSSNIIESLSVVSSVVVIFTTTVIQYNTL